MIKVYYSIATLTALFCLSFIAEVYDRSNTAIKIQHIDMSAYPIYITVKKGKQ